MLILKECDVICVMFSYRLDFCDVLAHSLLNSIMYLLFCYIWGLIVNFGKNTTFSQSFLLFLPVYVGHYLYKHNFSRFNHLWSFFYWFGVSKFPSILSFFCSLFLDQRKSACNSAFILDFSSIFSILYFVFASIYDFGSILLFICKNYSFSRSVSML